LKRISLNDGLWRVYAESEEAFYQGDFYPSVTTILGLLADDAFKKTMISMNERQFNTMMDKSAELGTRIHNKIAKDLLGTPEEPLDDEIPAMTKYLGLKKKHNLRADRAEITVYSDQFGFAGTTDFLDEQNNILGEIKTGKYLITAGWQACAYKYALEEMGISRDLSVVGVHVHRNGKEASLFKYQHFESCFTAFLSALNCWRMMYYNKLKGMKWKHLNSCPVKQETRLKVIDQNNITEELLCGTK